MAKLRGPLHSLEAHGDYAGQMLFQETKAGPIVKYSPLPRDRRSPEQIVVRNRLAVCFTAHGWAAKTTSVLTGFTASERDRWAAAAPPEDNWNAYLTASMLGANLATWTSAESAWNALSDRLKWQWGLAATTLQPEFPSVAQRTAEGATGTPMTAGEAFYHYMQGLGETDLTGGDYSTLPPFYYDTAAGVIQPAFPDWTPNNLQTGAHWPTTQRALAKIIATQPIDTGSTFTPNGSYPGGNAYYVGVLLPDGRVFCVPCNTTTARIYDPATNSVSTPNGSYPGNYAYTGGVLLPDGRVFCVPRNTTTARIYDPATNSVSTPNGTYPGNYAYYDGVLLPDGRVFCVPYNTTSARIYDPATNSLSTPNGTYPGSSAYAGGVLLPDGRVFCMPFNATTARIYDPATDSLSTPNGTYPGSSAYAGGVLLPDGRVFCMPFNATTARIYDPATNSVSTPNGSYPGNYAYTGGVLLPDGRVFCVPRNTTTARIYDPATNSVSTPNGSYPGNYAYTGGVLLPDGRVFCVPYFATSARIWGTTGKTLPLAMTTSPFFNKL